jgi:pyruvate dehydrogenase E2 component (dihydrolipoamide acetyltransferase)
MVQEGTLIRWVKVEGESVEKGQVLAEIETDKATVEVESSASGIIHRHLVEQGSIVPVGTPIVVIAAPGEKVDDSAYQAGEVAAKPEAKKEEPKPAETPAEPSEPEAGMEGGRVKASPLAKRVAGEHGIDLASIQGSGPGGRVVRKDIERSWPS